MILLSFKAGKERLQEESGTDLVLMAAQVVVFLLNALQANIGEH